MAKTASGLDILPWWWFCSRSSRHN